MYSKVTSWRRSLLFIKCLYITLSFFGKNDKAFTNQSLMLIKGSNQCRLGEELRPQLQQEFGDLNIAYISTLKSRLYKVSGFPLRSLRDQLYFLLLMLITGKRRYLNLYFLEFYSSIEALVENDLADITNLICLNDQPFDVAAIVEALNRRGNCRTIVIQHGLILSPQF